LSILSGQKDIVCSIISAGREHTSMQDIVGYFVNSLVVKQEVDAKESFNDLLHKVKSNMLEVFQYQAYPFELVLDEMKIVYPHVSAAFNMFNMQQEDTAKIERDNIDPAHTEGAGNIKFDMIIFVTEYKNNIELLLNYKKSLFKPATIEMFAGGYRRLISDLVKD
jgi:non-ribosomal peptide synthetase component F